MRERKTIIDYVKGSQRLKALREEKKISHQDLSEKTDINKQSLINYEKAGKDDGREIGTRVDAFCGMSVNNAVALAKTFGVSTDYLLGLSSVRSPDVDVQAVCNYTGLSQSAVERLHSLNSEYQAIASDIIESDLFYTGMLFHIGNALSTIKEAIAKGLPLTEGKKMKEIDGFRYMVLSPVDQAKYFIGQAAKAADSIFQSILKKASEK